MFDQCKECSEENCAPLFWVKRMNTLTDLDYFDDGLTPQNMGDDE